MKISYRKFKSILAENLILEYVKYIKGHKNSKGESAPWVIVSHETNKILSSHKSKEDAKEHLRQMHIFG